MSETPEEPEEGANPFKGTPFEQFFGFGLGANGGALFNTGAGMPDLSQLFGQIQAMMQPYDGPLNWDVALDLARKTVAAAGPDPTPSRKQMDAAADAVRLADHWLDETTTFPSAITTATAWSRAEWIVATADAWKLLVEPVAESSVSLLSGQLPPEVRAAAGPMVGIIGKAVGALFANQIGAGLGALAGDVLSLSEIGIPLAEPGRAALLPSNIPAFAEGLGVSEDDVLLYLALREAAHQRLFAGVPWLRDHLVGAVRDYAAGVEVNLQAIQERIEEQMRGIDPNDPSSLQQVFESNVFEVPQTPRQKAALERLEIALALVEGWVDEVVGQATAAPAGSGPSSAPRMPAAVLLQEAIRRRRASGGPAEQTFAQLVGLELRPRRLRDAAALWGSLRTRQGIEARDGVWMSPALLPTAADLDDPLGFREGAEAPEELSDAEFDHALRQLLDGPESDRPESHGAAPEDPDDASDTDE